METEYDVVIAGGGPTGLAVANALGQAGVKTLVLEREARIAESPRAVSIDDEALRFVQRLGLAGLAAGVILPGTGTRYYGSDGRPIAHAYGPPAHPLGHPSKNPIDHREFQQLLLDGLRRFDCVDVEFLSPLERFAQDAESVRVETRGPAGSRTVRCLYLLGADGGRSRVRDLLGIELHGRNHGQRWLIVDTLNDPNTQRYAMHHGDPRRPHVIVPGRAGRCRYEFLLFDETDDEATAPEFARQLIQPYRSELPEEDIVRRTVFTFHSLIAMRWRVGRVFLLGDAAHMMPPFAGQGLNSGLRDADNLSWKLACVLAGVASPAQLDSYEVERKPHVQAIIRLSETVGEVMMTTSRTRARARDVLFRAAQRIPPARRYICEMRFKPAPRHRAGLVRSRDGDSLAGRMLPQPPVLSSDGTIQPLDNLLGNGFALVALGTGGAFPTLSDPLWDELGATRVVVELDDRLPASPRGGVARVTDTTTLLRGLIAGPARVVLVRPDRFILGSFEPGGEAAFAQDVRVLLRGTPPQTDLTKETR